MPSLMNLYRRGDYYTLMAPAWVRNVWPRPESFNWFVKANRAQLVGEGALVRLGRGYFVDAEFFPQVAPRILGVRELSQNESQEAAA